MAGWDKAHRRRLDRRRGGPAGLLEERRGRAATGHAAITFEWYRTFLQFLIDNNAQTWFGWLIPFGELAVGLGLLLGALTGIAAFFGATMNMSFMLAGSASVNPIMFAFTVGLMLAWKVAGYYGLDRYLLPAWASRGTPRPGRLRPSRRPLLRLDRRASTVSGPAHGIPQGRTFPCRLRACRDGPPDLATVRFRPFGSADGHRSPPGRRGQANHRLSDEFHFPRYVRSHEQSKSVASPTGPVR